MFLLLHWCGGKLLHSIPWKGEFQSDVWYRREKQNLPKRQVSRNMGFDAEKRVKRKAQEPLQCGKALVLSLQISTKQMIHSEMITYQAFTPSTS
jgi:hypothetical protein